MSDRKSATIAKPEAWFHFSLAEGARDDRPGIYEWRIDGVGCYIGKYSSISRPKRAYAQIVSRIEKKLAYRKGKPNGFRRIHLALADAKRAGRRVEVCILENVEPEKLNACEQAWIKRRRHEEAAGGLPVLNGGSK